MVDRPAVSSQQLPLAAKVLRDAANLRADSLQGASTSNVKKGCLNKKKTDPNGNNKTISKRWRIIHLQRMTTTYKNNFLEFHRSEFDPNWMEHNNNSSNKSKGTCFYCKRNYYKYQLGRRWDEIRTSSRPMSCSWDNCDEHDWNMVEPMVEESKGTDFRPSQALWVARPIMAIIISQVTQVTKIMSTK